MQPWATALTALTLSAVVLSGAAPEQDVRDRLENVARAQDPSFPDGEKVKLTHFSYACRLMTADGPIYVSNRRAVIAGMPAPRGENALTFVDGHFRLLATIPYRTSLPLWCQGGKLFLFGSWDGQQFEYDPCADSRGCNVIDWSEGYAVMPGFYREAAYGSSDGVDNQGSETR